jgi:hypothetical protein
MEFPREVLGLIFSQLQLRRDYLTAKLVCKKWNQVTKTEWVQKMRLDNFSHNTCCASHLSHCHDCIGELQCERCDVNTLCRLDGLIRCVRCKKRICPDCCINSCAACVDCVTKCSDCQKTPIVPCNDDDNRRLYDIFFYCSDCDTIVCYKCLQFSECVSKHEIHEILKWRIRFSNFHR